MLEAELFNHTTYPLPRDAGEGWGGGRRNEIPEA